MSVAVPMIVAVPTIVLLYLPVSFLTTTRLSRGICFCLHLSVAVALGLVAAAWSIG
jgi:hypothetical protein